MAKQLKISQELLEMRQRMPLELKIGFSQKRIRSWYEQNNGNVYVAFSGGKDSTALLHLARSVYPDMHACFIHTGLEFPEIVKFAQSQENVLTLRPKYTFKQVIENFGYPVVSRMVASAIRRLQSPNTSERERNKILNGDERGSFGKLPLKYRYLIDAPFKISERCCEYLKHKPTVDFVKKSGKFPYVGTMAADSNRRRIDYLRFGCNIDNGLASKSTPIAFWRDQDIWDYIHQFKISYCSVYDEGEKHTGCLFCLFGIQFDESPNRIQRMKQLHTKLWRYCIEDLKMKQVMEYMGIPYE